MYYLHKDKTAGLNYEFALLLWEDRLVRMSGPFKASQHNLTIYQLEGGLRSKLDGKRGIADLSYQGDPSPSIPSSIDSVEFQRFKLQATACQEAFNFWLKCFGILSLKLSLFPKKGTNFEVRHL